MPPQYDALRLMSKNLNILPGRTITRSPRNWAVEEDKSDRVQRRRRHFSVIEGGRENHPRGHYMLREGNRRQAEYRKIERVRGGKLGYFMRYNGHIL